MNPSDTHDHQQLLGIVQQWSYEERVAFIHEILQTLVAKQGKSAKRVATLPSALGLARVATPPDDAQVQQWLDENRTEKYG
jgi:hypothetical protein